MLLIGTDPLHFPSPMPCITATLLAFSSLLMSASASEPSLQYPVSKKQDITDDYHGTKIADPYRWLEDENAEDTKAWVKAQNEVTFGYLEGIPQRAAIKERLTKLWNYERFGLPHRKGGRFFFSHNLGLQNQAVLHVADTFDAEPRVLLDPNALSADGTVALSSYSISEDGKLLAYGLSKAGSDWVEIHLKEVDGGKVRDDLVRWVKFSGISWAKDGSGFFYSRYDAPKEGSALTGKNEFHKLCFHRLGESQEKDSIIYERKDHPDWNLNGSVTDDGHYLIMEAAQGTDPKHRVFYKDLTKTAEPIVALLPDADASYDFIDNDGPRFFFRTDYKAQQYRVISIDVTKPHVTNWREVIPQGGSKLDSASIVGGQIICEYLKDARSVVRCFDLEGKALHEIALPGIGSAGGFGGKREDKDTFYSFTSFTEPGAIYRLDLASGQSSVWRKPKVNFDGDAYETKQVFVKSKDGTKVPMFIVHKKGLKPEGNHPTILYGYGGFNISLTPAFSISRAVWLEMGGVYATANLRGGGEYGADWHLSGTKLHKQNVFDDFISCAEWLVEHRYTSPKKLAIQGGSNGGLLVGACMTQRPELFGAALPAVGVMDMLRFHKFTIGWAWNSDFGSSEDAEEFKALHAYSPLHNLKPGTHYPATMVTTSDHDDRVVPAHSFKFAATLQECQAKDGPPVLIRIETSAGHGAGTALNKTIESTADQWAFLVKELGLGAAISK
jgi:prolyl oligopeptidase